MNTTTTLPELRRSTPTSRPYRLFTVAELPYLLGKRKGYPTVVVDGWCTAYVTGTDIVGARLDAHRPDVGWGEPGHKHPLDGTFYPSGDVARRMAYEAGLTAFMVYEDQRVAS